MEILVTTIFHEDNPISLLTASLTICLIGKGILYEDDDEPIKLLDQDYSNVIKEYHMSLIGKILNPKKQDNLKEIGSRLGHVDTLELLEGRMLIDVDSRRPLKFKGKLNLQKVKKLPLSSNMRCCLSIALFVGYCPSLSRSQSQAERGDVFARVQLPPNSARQNSIRNYHNTGLELTRQPSLREHHSSAVQARHPIAPRSHVYGDRQYDAEAYLRRNRGEENRYGSHKDRIVRGRDKHKNKRYGDSRYGNGPYDRKYGNTWRQKPRQDKTIVYDDVAGQVSGSRDVVTSDVVPYEHSSNSKEKQRLIDFNNQNSEVQKTGEERQSKRLASAIVTPSRLLQAAEDNATVRTKGATRSLTYSPLNKEDANAMEDDQMIGALNDMELITMMKVLMECNVQEDDLLGEDLMEMEDGVQPYIQGVTSKAKVIKHGSKTAKGSTVKGNKNNVPLGIQSRKTEFLRR
ncbi:LOW QUALITY PROTEIN: hypothetical protein HID58_080085, partial [Brassica napus]